MLPRICGNPIITQVITTSTGPLSIPSPFVLLHPASEAVVVVVSGEVVARVPADNLFAYDETIIIAVPAFFFIHS